MKRNDQIEYQEFIEAIMDYANECGMDEVWNEYHDIKKDLFKNNKWIDLTSAELDWVCTDEFIDNKWATVCVVLNNKLV